MNSRLIAARVLGKLFKDGQSLTAALDLECQSLDSIKERAFIQALCYGVIRQYFRLDYILNLLLSKPLKDHEVKALALIGLYQLKYMRVKPHAAVSETVAAVPRKKVWAKPLLNAVLRNYQRQQVDLEQRADFHEVSRSGHPEWLHPLIAHDWPDQVQSILSENNRQAPMVLRVNLALNSRTEYLQRLQCKNIIAETVNACPSALILEQATPVEELPGFAEGWVSVQDSAAQLAAYLLDAKPHHRVLDVCAAPGGKACHILEMQPELAELVAVDIDSARMQRVRENLQRLQLQAKLIVGDGARPDDWWDGLQFDRILLDAPCSALGVIRRHPDIRLLRRPEDIKQLQQMQHNILRMAWPLLMPGGILLYATCSILKGENELQIKAFMQEYSDATEWVIDEEWGLARPYGRQILTGQAGMDGFYYARIRKL